MFDDTDDGTPRHRRNGLSRPFSRAQIAAWIALAVSVLQYALFVAPILPVSAILPVTLVFVLAVAAVVYAGAQTVLIDPVDVHLCRHWRTTTAIATAAAAALSNNNSNSNDDHEEDHNNNNNNNEHHQNQHSRNNNNHNSGAVAVVEISYNALRNPMHRPPALYKNATATTKTTLFDALYLRANAMRQAQPLPATEAMKHCWICDVTVADHSMHCKFCNKCVYHYDHHCMWLNTCIGSANYEWFYRTLQSLCAMQVVHLAVQLYLVIDLLLRDGPTRQRVESRGILHGANDDDDQAATTATATVLFVFVAFNMASLALIGQLIQFHRVLQRENLTTYEFVVRDHKEKRAQARLAGDLEAQRVVLVKKAEREGRTGLALKLRVGGACRQTTGAECCDPLNLPDPPPEPDPEAGFASVLGDGVSGGGVAATDNDDDGIGFGGVGSYANGDGAHAANSYSYADADDDEVNDYSNNNSSTNELLLLPPTSSHSRRSMRSSNETTVAEEQEPPAAAAAAPAGEQQQLVDLMHEVGLQQEQTLQTNTQTTSGMSDTASSCAVQEDLDIMYDNNCGVDNSNYSNFSHDDSVEVDTHDNIITGSLRNTDIQLLPPLETNNSLLNDLSDDQLLMAEGDEDDDGDADGDETFENEPDDVSYTSGCSGRSSNRSGRSARSINKATAAAAMGERDYTAF